MLVLFGKELGGIPPPSEYGVHPTDVRVMR